MGRTPDKTGRQSSYNKNLCGQSMWYSKKRRIKAKLNRLPRKRSGLLMSETGKIRSRIGKPGMEFLGRLMPIIEERRTLTVRAKFFFSHYS
ncbi:hypothetical protein TNCV_97521 [Trichonephila clavipes]|nr:hypothetical protein TNCV_97521 [Trichonephila clavipes]